MISVSGIPFISTIAGSIDALNIHRSHIVAIDRVNSMLNRKVRLASYTELPVSDAYAAFIREWK